MKLCVPAIALFALALGATALAQTIAMPPKSAAQPIEAPGTSNFYKVGDTLYRSAQPTAEGFRSLKNLGIVTVVNLRSYHSDRAAIGSTGLASEHIYMKAWHPERKEIVRFLQIATAPKRTPVLVHCQHGSDRTGAMVAAYRNVVQGWSKEAAVQEMTSEDFGFHSVWTNLPDWINDLDVKAIRKEAGIGDDTVELLTRQADLWDKAIVRRDRAAIDPYTVEDFEVRIYGDVALLSGRTNMTGRYEGKPFTSHYRYIDIYVRRNGAWTIVSVQITKIPSWSGV